GAAADQGAARLGQLDQGGAVGDRGELRVEAGAERAERGEREGGVAPLLVAAADQAAQAGGEVVPLGAGAAQRRRRDGEAARRRRGRPGRRRGAAVVAAGDRGPARAGLGGRERAIDRRRA